MNEVDVFNKLSRILETHESENGSSQDDVMDDLVNAFGDGDGKTTKTRNAPKVKLPDRPTPYEVWQAKQTKKDYAAKKAAENSKAKLTPAQLSKMVTKMHVSNRIKQDETFKAQNEGLRSELAGFEFKPRINKTSRDLASTMKPIAERMPEMVAERERILTRKREDRAKDEMLSCAFKPTRVGAKTSDRYLKKMGRTKVSKPEDFFAFQAEKVRRNEQRKAIIESIESRDLLFSPQLPESSRRLHDSMINNPSNTTIYDPVSRTTKVIRSPRKVTRRNESGELMDSATGTLNLSQGIYESRSRGENNSDYAGIMDDLVEGPPLLLESDHPYRHNLNEYTSVSVPGAVSYTITFDERTATEPVSDFVRFLKYDDQTVVIGAAKYNGGSQDPKKAHLNLQGEQRHQARTSHNWPGYGGRAPLTIHANKFVVHFKTNGSLNDWGFKMQIVPTISARLAMSTDPSRDGDTFKPQISSKGHMYHSQGKSKNGTKNGTGSGTGTFRSSDMSSTDVSKSNIPIPIPIHERLYNEAVTKKNDEFNRFVQTLSYNVNIELKPWEQTRDVPGGSHEPEWIERSRTHVGKSMLGPALNDLLLFDGDHRTVAVASVGISADGDDIWKAITCQNQLLVPNHPNRPVHSDMHGGNSPNYGHGGLGGGGEDPDMNEGTGVDSPSHWEEDYGKMKMSDF